MICYARGVLARCIINTESLRACARARAFPSYLSTNPHSGGSFQVLDFPERLSARARARLVRLGRIATPGRARPRRNPVGKLIRSDNPEEFDVGLRPLASARSAPIPGVNPSHIRERLPLIIFSCWALSHGRASERACICARPLGASRPLPSLLPPLPSPRVFTQKHVAGASALGRRGVGVRACFRR